jgi:lipopolysaccharide heptosyltransferase I
VPTSTLHTRQFERILLIKPSAVGDVIHALPVLARLRARYPAARIDWLLTPANADLVGRHPALSNVLLFARQEWSRPWRGWAAAAGLWRLVSAIRRVRYDLVVDLHGQFRSALFALASGAPVRVGFDRPRRAVRRASRPLPTAAYRHGWTGAREGAWVVYTHAIPIPTLDAHAVDRYLWLSRLLGLDEGPVEFHVPAPPAAEAHAAALLERYGLAGRPLAVLVPGTTWQTKQWHAGGFAEVAGHLLRAGRAVALAGSARERGLCQAVADAAPGTCNLGGQTTLSQLAALLRRAAVCVTNDSGAMHLTAALGRPVVSVFGPTDPVWVGPYGRPEAVVRADVPCAPCYLRKLRQCPHEHACMRDVTAAMVIDRVEAALGQAGELRCA